MAFSNVITLSLRKDALSWSLNEISALLLTSTIVSSSYPSILLGASHRLQQNPTIFYTHHDDRCSGPRTRSRRRNVCRIQRRMLSDVSKSSTVQLSTLRESLTKLKTIVRETDYKQIDQTWVIWKQLVKCEDRGLRNEAFKVQKLLYQFYLDSNDELYYDRIMEMFQSRPAQLLHAYDFKFKIEILLIKNDYDGIGLVLKESVRYLNRESVLDILQWVVYKVSDNLKTMAYSRSDIATAAMNMCYNTLLLMHGSLNFIQQGRYRIERSILTDILSQADLESIPALEKLIERNHHFGGLLVTSCLSTLASDPELYFDLIRSIWDLKVKTRNHSAIDLGRRKDD